MSDQACDAYVLQLFGVNPADYPALPEAGNEAVSGPGTIGMPSAEPLPGAGFGNNPHAVNPYKPAPVPSPARLGEVDTPYGKLVRTLPDTFPNAAQFHETTLGAVSLDEGVRISVKVMKKHMDGEAAAAAFVKKSFDTLEGEIDAHQNEAVKTVARSLGEQLDQLKYAYTLLDSIKMQMNTAQRMYESAETRLSGLTDSKEASQLLDKANARSSGIATALSLIGNVVELSAAIGTDNPLGAMKPIYDIVTTIEQLAGRKHTNDKANELRQSGTNKQIESAYLDMDSAQATLEEAATVAGKLKVILDDAGKFLVETQTDAEGAYDTKAAPPAGFKFKDLNAHLKWAEDGVTATTDFVAECGQAYIAAEALVALYKMAMKGLKPDADEFTSLAAGMLAARDMSSAQSAAQGELQSDGKRCRDMLSTLGDMRNRGNQRMVHAPLPPAKH